MHYSRSPASKLLYLPTELLSRVFMWIQEIADAACLCLSDGRLFEVGFPRFVELQRTTFASWADRRVLCLGEYTRDHDYPEAVEGIVAAQIQEFFDGDDEDNAQHEDDDENETKYFVEMVEEHYERADRYFSTYKSCRSSDDYFQYRLRKDRQAYFSLCQEEYDGDDKVLCNLSKGEYVRGEPVAKLEEEADTTLDYLSLFTTRPPNLGHALFSRICWSSDDSTSLVYAGGIHRGSWAGDRFEVTTMARLRRGIDWKDVSDEVVDFLRKVWKAEE